MKLEGVENVIESQHAVCDADMFKICQPSR